MESKILELLEKIRESLGDEAYQTTLKMWNISEQSKCFVELGGGGYALMRSVCDLYSAEVNLYLWTR